MVTSSNGNITLLGLCVESPITGGRCIFHKVGGFSQGGRMGYPACVPDHRRLNCEQSTTFTIQPWGMVSRLTDTNIYIAVKILWRVKFSNLYQLNLLDRGTEVCVLWCKYLHSTWDKNVAKNISPGNRYNEKNVLVYIRRHLCDKKNPLDCQSPNLLRSFLINTWRHGQNAILQSKLNTHIS